MADMTQYFLASADAAWQRKKDLYTQILSAILTQELPDPKERRAQLELLGREETRLRTLKEQLDKTQREMIKSDADLMQAITEARTDIAVANINYNRDVKTATIDLAAQLSKERTAVQERATGYATDARTNAQGTLSRPIAFGSGANASAIAQLTSQTAKQAWDDSFKSAFNSAPDAISKQAVVDEYKQFVDSLVSTQRGYAGASPAGVALGDADVLAQIKQSSLVGIPDSGKTSAQLLAEKQSADDAMLAGQGGSTGVATRLLTSRLEKAQSLLGTQAKDLSIDFTGKPSDWEQYLVTATYNRMNLAEPEEAAKFYSAFPSVEEFKAYLLTGEGNKSPVDGDKGYWRNRVMESELLTSSSLKSLYEGVMPRDYGRLLQDQESLEARKRKLLGEEGDSPEDRYASAVAKARVIYRKLYGPQRIQDGIEAAEFLRDELGSLSKDEQDKAVASLPLTDRQKQIMLKAARGESILDTELVKLGMEPNKGIELSDRVTQILEEAYPGLLKNDKLLYSEGGKEVSVPLVQATVVDLAKAITSRADVDPEVKDKLRESARRVQELGQVQPYIIPRLNAMTSQRIEDWIGATTRDIATTPDMKAADRVIDNGPTGSELDLLDEPPLRPVPSILIDKARRIPEPKDTTPPDISPTVGRGEPQASMEMQFLDAPGHSLEKGSQLRLDMTKRFAPDVIASAQQSNPKPKASQVILGIEESLSGFTKIEKQNLRELAKQSINQDSKNTVANIEKIINPVVDPSKFEKALQYIGQAANPNIKELYDNEELMYLI